MDEENPLSYDVSSESNYEFQIHFEDLHGQKVEFPDLVGKLSKIFYDQFKLNTSWYEISIDLDEAIRKGVEAILAAIQQDVVIAIAPIMEYELNKKDR